MKVPAVERLLLESPPFSEAPRDELSRLAPTLTARRFHGGEALYSEGEPARAGWLIAEGSVRVLAFARGSRLMELERLGRGQLAGLYCRLGRRAESHVCTAVADGAVEAVRIPDDVFDRFLARFEGFSGSACRSCAARLGAMLERTITGRESVDQRVATALLTLSGIQGSRVAVTRQRLAVDAGTVVETVFRSLARFRARGWVATGRGYVLVHDAAALRSVAEGKRRA